MFSASAEDSLYGTSSTLAVAAVAEDDVALKLRDARKRLKALHARRDELRANVALVRADHDRALANEDALFARLARLRYTANERAFYISRFTSDAELLRETRTLMEQRREEDELTLRNVDIELDKLRSECSEVVHAMEAQRADALRQIHDMSRTFSAAEREARRQRAELRSIELETREVLDRAEAAYLKHARELFGVAPGH